MTLNPPTLREWVYYCADCGDTGWRSYECGTGPSARYGPHIEVRRCHGRVDGCTGERVHEWVEACSCRPRNPAWLKRFKSNESNGR